MKMFAVSFIILISSIIAMAIGVILSNKQLKGSCGGLNRVMGEDCLFCGNKEECDTLGHNQCEEDDCEHELNHSTVLETISNI